MTTKIIRLLSPCLLFLAIGFYWGTGVESNRAIINIIAGIATFAIMLVVTLFELTIMAKESKAKTN